MKICIVSDSHDRAPPLAAAVTAARAEGAQAVVHCGDLIGANMLRPLLALGLPVHFFHGNNLGDAVAIWKMCAKSAGLLNYHGGDADLGALAFPEPDKSQKQIRDIVESAYDHGAEMIVTPCPLCQANVEVYQSEINRTQGTKFNMPVFYCSQLRTVAWGGSAKEAGLDGQLIRATRLEEIAAKK